MRTKRELLGENVKNCLRRLKSFCDIPQPRNVGVVVRLFKKLRESVLVYELSSIIKRGFEYEEYKEKLRSLLGGEATRCLIKSYARKIDACKGIGKSRKLYMIHYIKVILRIYYHGVLTCQLDCDHETLLHDAIYWILVNDTAVILSCRRTIEAFRRHPMLSKKCVNKHIRRGMLLAQD